MICIEEGIGDNCPRHVPVQVFIIDQLRNNSEMAMVGYNVGIVNDESKK